MRDGDLDGVFRLVWEFRLQYRYHPNWQVVHMGRNGKTVRIEYLALNLWLVTWWADTSDESFSYYQSIPVELIRDFFAE